jgi:hypothetical protein
MEKRDGQKMVEAFYYVRDVYRNISRMLLSCDPLMDEKRFSTNLNWISVWPDRALKLFPGNISDTWLPYFVVRHYYSIDDQLDLVNIGAVTWDYHRPQFDMPLCIASRMLVPDSSAKELMWISVLQMWDSAARPDGQVRLLNGGDLDSVKKGLGNQFAQRVRGGRILSVACPLLEVGDIAVLENRLINPLLARGRAELDVPQN